MATTQKSVVVNLLLVFVAIGPAIPLFWLLRGFPWWVVLSFLVYWSAATALVAFARKSVQSRHPTDAGGMRNDRPFLIGQVLGTLSCCAPLFLIVPHIGSWDLLRGFGVIFSFGAAVIALFILPFGRKRAKWLTVSGCVMNVALFAFCGIYALSVVGWPLD